jgi:hypothetical protein
MPRKIVTSAKPAAKPAAVAVKLPAPAVTAVASAVIAAPAKPLPAVASPDKLASVLANRETKNADYFAHARYPAEKLSAADQPYVTAFSRNARTHSGVVHTAELDIADRDAGRLVNNRARAKRLVTLGYMLRVGTPEQARFSFVSAVTQAAAPAGASPNLLAVRTLYNKA